MARPATPSSRTWTLYHVPPSFYSQVARLVLTEKQIAYRAAAAVPGPPNFGTYRPWYMRLNPMGTVPTLVRGDEVLDDSRKIMELAGATPEGPSLRPSDAHALAEMERWVDDAYAISERVLAYGSDRMQRMGLRVNAGRRRALVSWRDKAPELAEVYTAKLADLDRFMADAADADTVKAQLDALGSRLDTLNEALHDRDFICGDDYSLADVIWTVTVARKIMMGHDVFASRPHLHRWFQRMRARPSFDAADVWTRFKPHKMIPIALREFRRHLIVAGVACVSLALVLAWLLG